MTLPVNTAVSGLPSKVKFKMLAGSLAASSSIIRSGLLWPFTKCFRIPGSGKDLMPENASELKLGIAFFAS